MLVMKVMPGGNKGENERLRTLESDSERWFQEQERREANGEIGEASLKGSKFEGLHMSEASLTCLPARGGLFPSGMACHSDANLPIDGPLNKTKTPPYLSPWFHSCCLPGLLENPAFYTAIFFLCPLVILVASAATGVIPGFISTPSTYSTLDEVKSSLSYGELTSAAEYASGASSLF